MRTRATNALLSAVLADGGARLLRDVARCPDRGGVLPHSLQPECGCSELNECRAGRGSTPGRVTLDDCLLCAAGRQEDVRVDSLELGVARLDAGQVSE